MTQREVEIRAQELLDKMTEIQNRPPPTPEELAAQKKAREEIERMDEHFEDIRKEMRERREKWRRGWRREGELARRHYEKQKAEEEEKRERSMKRWLLLFALAIVGLALLAGSVRGEEEPWQKVARTHCAAIFITASSITENPDKSVYMYRAMSIMDDIDRKLFAEKEEEFRLQYVNGTRTMEDVISSAKLCIDALG